MSTISYLLLLVLWIPLLFFFIIFFFYDNKYKQYQYTRYISLIGTFIVFLTSLILFFSYFYYELTYKIIILNFRTNILPFFFSTLKDNWASSTLQVIFERFVIKSGDIIATKSFLEDYFYFIGNSKITANLSIYYFNWFNFLNINYVVNVDGLSIFFILLTTFLFSICILISWNSILYNFKEFCLFLFLSEYFILNFFAVMDLFIFFFFFECILIPIYLIVGIWGSNLRKTYASYQMFFFTIFGSIFMFFSILYIYTILGSTDFFILQTKIHLFDTKEKILLFVFFFLSFSIKVPIVPFHFWLPEAHVEAPTSGSIILAGLLLKLGTYGLVRFLIPLFWNIIEYLSPILFSICIYGTIYISFIILRQLDLKRIIAYSSIIHMNFILLGLLIFNKNALIGGIFLCLSHGIISSGLFICIGFLYERYHTRIILYYKGLCTIMPIFTVYYFIFILANASLPGTSNFIGEFITLIGIFEYNKILAILLIITLFYSGITNFWIYNKMVFGDLNLRNYIQKANDLNHREILVLLILIFFIIFNGIYPQSVINIIKFYVYFMFNNSITDLTCAFSLEQLIFKFLKEETYI